MNRFISFLRFGNWVPMLGLTLIGYFINGFNLSSIRITNFMLVLLSSSFFLCHGYSLNNIYDLKNDNNPLYFEFVMEHSGKLKFFSYALLLLAIFSAYLINLPAFSVMLCGCSISILYSVFRLKNISGLRVLLNVLGFSTLLLIGFLGSNYQFLLKKFLLLLFFSILFILFEIIHELSHIEMDREEYENNTFTLLGGRNYVILFYGISILLFIYNLYVFKKMNHLSFSYFVNGSFIISMNILFTTKLVLKGLTAENATVFRGIITRLTLIYGVIFLLTL